ncbi:MAG TPA: hypothetical protein VFO18_13070 [Methylomirabilota bacterium]|nr:hypothetical protein [Methylomirabilota bacterium]
MKPLAVLVLCVVWAASGVPAQAQAQRNVPGGRPPDAIDHATGLATRPYTTLPLPATPPQVYVPERRVFSPELGREVVVPGHWERRVSGQRVDVPSLPVLDPRTGRIITVPAGERPPVDQRQGP